MGTEEGLIVITGCAHPGIDQMVTAAVQTTGRDAVSLVMGGFHLGNVGRARIDEIVDTFGTLSVRRVAPTHCTGDVARQALRQAYGDAFLSVGLGATVIE